MGYPNLARSNLAPDQFDTTWPLVLPVRLFAYFPRAGLTHRMWLVDQAPVGSWYPIGLAWHDFDCDYFALISDNARQRIQSGDIKILFYYHEGDNPADIKQRMTWLCRQHHMPKNCYWFVSANSAAKNIDQFVYFPDHELFFQYINRRQHAEIDFIQPRAYDFTILSRTHKWWRATALADLARDHLLDQSLWSYNIDVDISDDPSQNPIGIDSIPGLRSHLEGFVSGGPYRCDGLDAQAHNDHRHVNLDLYQHSWCHVVLETHFDADQSGGTFLTEKTYKCLKFGQPFVIVGPPGSVAALRERGYRMCDHAIDHSYDSVLDNTERWIAIKQELCALKSRMNLTWLQSCRADLEWNRHHFMHAHGDLLENLVSRLSQLNTGTP